MDSLWGPQSVDRFADDHNAKVKTFNCKYWCHNISQVDAFAVSWQGENNWLVPPIDLVGQAVKHLKACKAQATFNSKYWCHNISQVDAFAVSWQGENNWLVPPIDLVGQAVKHLKACKAQATLVIPYWPSAVFWPILFSSDSTVVSVVEKVFRFSDPSFIYVQRMNKNSVFDSDRFTSEVLCVRLNGRLYGHFD